MTDRKPTPAQLVALKYVAANGESLRPHDYHRRNHGVDVRRDVWERCHELGWLRRDKGRGWPSRLTELGQKAVDA